MKRIQKIITIKPHELFFRFHRRMKISQERLGLLKEYKIHGESAQMGICPRFGFEKDKDKVRESLRVIFPDEVERIIKKGKKILAHRFDLLGYGNLYFGDEIDWSYEPIRRKNIPNVHWSKISPLKSEDVGDLKVVWELNRHQHLVTLGQAYFLTQDSQFAAEVFEQICDWQARNPPHKGPNWASSLEVAFRLISWIWAIRLIKESQVCSKAFLRDIATWVGEHARHIERYLSTYYSPNTHLTGEALGLFYAGAFFPHLHEASRWKKKGETILFRMLPIHLLQDGGYVERTLWYHQYTINFYIHFFILLKDLGEELPNWALDKLEQGVSFLMYSLRPDRTIPMIGDDDGGFFLPVCTAPLNDPRGILAVSAILFRRPDFKALSGGSRPEILWLLGTDGENIYQNLAMQLPGEMSKAFRETGYFFLRSGWGLDDNYIAFDCGPHGWLNGGHAHADLLSFHVVSGNNSVIEDPGTYLYINEGGWRDFFRGPKSHATVWVDGKYPATPSGNFHWDKIPTHKLLQFSTEPGHDYVAGSMMIEEISEIIREIHFIKPYYLIVMDTINGDEGKEVEVRFPLSIGKWTLTEIGCWQDGRENQSGIIPLGNARMVPSFESSWYSSIYGRKESTNILVLRGSLSSPFQLAYLIDLSGKKPREKPSFNVKRNIFRLFYKGESWIGFGTFDPNDPTGDGEIRTDYKAGLLKQNPCGRIDVLALHEGSYLYFQGKEVKA
jgi:hypothetical protein